MRGRETVISESGAPTRVEVPVWAAVQTTTGGRRIRKMKMVTMRRSPLRRRGRSERPVRFCPLRRLGRPGLSRASATELATVASAPARSS
jgi:hypothetical protein